MNLMFFKLVKKSETLMSMKELFKYIRKPTVMNKEGQKMSIDMKDGKESITNTDYEIIKNPF